jgi:hypothetical protein
MRIDDVHERVIDAPAAAVGAGAATTTATAPLLLDRFLPRYDAFEHHEITVDAPVPAAWAAVRDLDLSRSPVVAALLAVRGIPALLTGERSVSRHVGLDAILAAGFVVLADDPPHELVLGVVGRFWQPTSGLRRVNAGEFEGFDEPGYAKGVWNFTVRADGDDRSVVATETRVHCTDATARRRFLRYWRLIGPFSALIRVLLLRSIARGARTTRTR